ncbi:MAG: YqgE/AlgH family protein [Acidimicrobiia bacterium]|nr:YqgE/AlgH family protein [Acidimicrobiia bacterium]
MAASFSGKLLVANPLLEDPNFYRTVVLLFEHGEEGAFGTVLNRPTEEAASEHLPQWSQLIAPPDVVFVGGPVRNEIAVGVGEWESAEEAGEGSLFSGIGFVDLTDPPDAETAPLRVRVFSGYSGWDAGQLEVELAVDSWFVLEPIVGDVFGDPAGLWGRVLQRQPGRLSLYARYPDDISLN